MINKNTINQSYIHGLSNGKIYRLVCNTTGKQYIGSTTQLLTNRKSVHKEGYKRWLEGKNNYISSFEIVAGGNFDIVLIENFPCNSKEELNTRERHYIDTLACVNKNRPTGVSYKDKLVYYKEYRQCNREKINESSRKYVENNPEKRKESSRNYYYVTKKQFKLN